MIFQKEYELAKYLGYTIDKGYNQWVVTRDDGYTIPLQIGLDETIEQAWDYFFGNLKNEPITAIHRLCFENLFDSQLQLLIYQYITAQQILCKFKNGYNCQQWELKEP